MGQLLCTRKSESDPIESETTSLSVSLPESVVEIMNMISTLQSQRMDSQRAELRPTNKTAGEGKPTSLPGALPLRTNCTRPEDDFLEMIVRVQGSRLEDQRSELPAPQPKEKEESQDDFFSLIMRAQAPRMEDQRANIPLKPSNSKE